MFRFDTSMLTRSEAMQVMANRVSTLFGEMDESPLGDAFAGDGLTLTQAEDIWTEDGEVHIETDGFTSSQKFGAEYAMSDEMDPDDALIERQREAVIQSMANAIVCQPSSVSTQTIRRRIRADDDEEETWSEVLDVGTIENHIQAVRVLPLDA